MKKRQVLIISFIIILFTSGISILLYPKKNLKTIDRLDKLDKKIEQGRNESIESDYLLSKLPQGHRVDLKKIQEMDSEFFLFRFSDENKNVKEIEVHRKKLGIRLNQDEMGIYLNFIRGGGFQSIIRLTNHYDLKLNKEEKKSSPKKDDKKSFSLKHNGYPVHDGSDLIRYITYDHLIAIINHLNKLVKEDQKDIKNDLKKSDIYVPPLIFKNNNSKKKKVIEKIRFSNPVIIKLTENNEKIRIKVIESMLGGLMNPDPRVRLVATHLIRRLIPEDFSNYLMTKIVTKLTSDPYSKNNISTDRLEKKEYIYETVLKKAYFYKELSDTENPAKVIYQEMLKLRRFIYRFILVKQINEGDVQTIRTIPNAVYFLLNTPIDNEAPCRIPMNYLSSEKAIFVIKEGLKNRSEYVRLGSANTLIRILRTKGVSSGSKKMIFRTLLKSKYRTKLLSGWTVEDIEKMSSKQMNKLMNLYLKKVKLIRPCPKDADDKYDDRSNPAGYIYKEFKDNPLTKEEVQKKDTDENKSQEDLKGLKKDTQVDLTKEYIFE